jgi:hypothetical protein
VSAAVIRRDDRCGAVAASVHALDLFSEPLQVAIECVNVVEIAIAGALVRPVVGLAKRDVENAGLELLKGL